MGDLGEWLSWLDRQSPEWREVQFTLPNGGYLQPLGACGFPSGWHALLTPSVVGAGEWKELGRDLGNVIDAIDHAKQRQGRATGPGVSADLRFVLDFAPAQDWAAITRADLVYGESGFRLCELNAGPNVGGGPIADLTGRSLETSTRFEQVRDAEGLGRSEIMPALAANIRERFGADVTELAVGYWRTAQFNMPPHFMRAFCRQLTEAGLPTRVVALEDLSISPAGVFEGDRAVRHLYRFFWETDGRDDSLVERLRALREAESDGLVVVVGGFVGNLEHGKLAIAWVSSAAQAGSLPPELAESVNRLVPWTRVIEVAGMTDAAGVPIPDVAEFLLTRRADLVIKSAFGFDSADVVVGVDTASDDWSSAVDRALAADSPWIVQAYVPTAVTPAWVSGTEGVRRATGRSMFGAFTIDRKLVGMIERYSADPDASCVSVPRGAAQCAVYVAAEGHRLARA